MKIFGMDHEFTRGQKYEKNFFEELQNLRVNLRNRGGLNEEFTKVAIGINDAGILIGGPDDINLDDFAAPIAIVSAAEGNVRLLYNESNNLYALIFTTKSSDPDIMNAFNMATEGSFISVNNIRRV